MNKILVGVIASVLAIALVSAAVYFNSINVTINATEARSSSDSTPVTLSCYSGETKTTTVHISNAANVKLCSNLGFNVTDNPSGVTYSIAGLGTVETGAGTSDAPYNVSVTCDETTPAGTLTGTINYEPIDCPI